MTSTHPPSSSSTSSSRLEAHRASIERLSTLLVEDHDLESVLDQIVTAVHETMPAAAAVSVTHIDADSPKTVASTHEMATAVDEKQYDLDSGPCLECARENEPKMVKDMSVEQRWPDLVPFALEQGVKSSLSMPLPVRDKVVGAINIYSDKVHQFGEEDAREAMAFAAHAAVAIANVTAYSATAYLAKNLELALASRAAIEQAKGMVMMRMGCSPDDAFDLLRQLSQRTNRKLRDVAVDIVERRIEL